MRTRFLAYLRLIDWCALSTSALILLVFLWLTLLPIPQNNNQYESAQKASDNKSADIRPSADNQIAAYTFWVMIFTGVLAVSTIGLWRATYNIAKDSANGLRQTERAYIKISHTKKFTPKDPESVHFSFEIKNLGRTPAHVRDVIIEMHTGGEPTSTPPPFSSRPRDKTSSFLVSGDHFVHNVIYKITPAEIEAMNQGTLIVWLFGVVNYDDVFGQGHQAGYGRIFNKIAGDFVFIANDRYNYDRLHPS